MNVSRSRYNICVCCKGGRSSLEGIYMNKYLIVATAVFAIAGSASALAQQRFAERPFARLSAEDLGAITDARVAALKAGLALTSDQAKNWPAFEQAYRNLAKLRSDRRLAARSQTQGSENETSVDRLQRRADRISQYGAALEDLAKAAQPLYQSLSDPQKRRFVMLSRVLQPRHRHFAMWHHGDGDRSVTGPH
jgi:zinc resistance-associated protein